jgi:hypothetical protein
MVTKSGMCRGVKSLHWRKKRTVGREVRESRRGGCQWYVPISRGSVSKNNSITARGTYVHHVNYDCCVQRRNIGKHTIDKKGKSPTTYESMTLPPVVSQSESALHTVQQHDINVDQAFGCDMTVFVR